VRDTVSALGRAVRTGDVLNHAANYPNEFDISPELITRDILNLKETGDLLLIESIRHRDCEGKNYYLPYDLDPTDFTAERPLTWLEEVAGSFNELWEERTREAAALNRLPRPVSSVELRDYMMTLPQPPPNLQKRMFLVNALTQISGTDSAVVRKVRRPGQRAILWVSSDVSEEGIDLGDLFVSDSERVCEAAARAVRHLSRPVNIKDIRAEIKLDPALRPASTASLPSIVSDVAKLQKQSSRQGIDIHHPHNLVRIFRAGRIDNYTYYYHRQEGLDDAKFYVQFEQLKRKWATYGAIEQMTALAGCAYPSIALGRALMIEVEAKRIKISLERLLKTKHGTAEIRIEAESLIDQVRSIIEQVQLWLKDKPRLSHKFPSVIDLTLPTWTAAELLTFLKPFYPIAQKITDTNRLIRLVFGNIRRVPNPNFRSRFNQAPCMLPFVGTSIKLVSTMVPEKLCPNYDATRVSRLEKLPASTL
jgi:hypothetical protein